MPLLTDMIVYAHHKSCRQAVIMLMALKHSLHTLMIQKNVQRPCYQNHTSYIDSPAPPCRFAPAGQRIRVAHPHLQPSCVLQIVHRQTHFLMRLPQVGQGSFQCSQRAPRNPNNRNTYEISLAKFVQFWHT